MADKGSHNSTGETATVADAAPFPKGAVQKSHSVKDVAAGFQRIITDSPHYKPPTPSPSQVFAPSHGYMAASPGMHAKPGSPQKAQTPSTWSAR